MTKKIEELFNLDDSIQEPEHPKVPSPTHEQVKTLEQRYAAVNEITDGLPQIQELDNLDEKELDALASKAEKAYDDLMDLGMNVEVRYAGRIFEVAASMMGNAITAKTNKIEKKLKAVDLQLKKLKIDNDKNPASGDVLNGEGFVITDRNELLKKLGQKE